MNLGLLLHTPPALLPYIINLLCYDFMLAQLWHWSWESAGMVDLKGAVQ